MWRLWGQGLSFASSSNSCTEDLLCSASETFGKGFIQIELRRQELWSLDKADISGPEMSLFSDVCGDLWSKHALFVILKICSFYMKVGASVLSRALARLPKGSVRKDVLVGMEDRDDAAVVVPPPAGHVMVQTVDFFHSFISDPYEFGAVAANNALGVSLI